MERADARRAVHRIDRLKTIAGVNDCRELPRRRLTRQRVSEMHTVATDGPSIRQRRPRSEATYSRLPGTGAAPKPTICLYLDGGRELATLGIVPEQLISSKKMLPRLETVAPHSRAAAKNVAGASRESAAMQD